MKTNMSGHQRGFSLVEILICLAVIGIIIGISVPVLGRMREGARESTIRANAHHIAATAANAVSAGSPALLASTNREQAIRLLREGVFGDGDFATTRFQITLRDDDVTEASAWLRFSGGLLIFEEPEP